jgi:hypothetical protein
MQDGSFLMGNGVWNINKFNVDIHDTIFMTSLPTPGEINAATTTLGGVSAIAVGIITGNPYALGTGIPLLTEGLTLSSIELMGGDTIGYPNPWQILTGIVEGYNKSTRQCNGSN